MMTMLLLLLIVMTVLDVVALFVIVEKSCYVVAVGLLTTFAVLLFLL
jgi:hypothetical protein